MLGVALEKHRSDHCILVWDVNRGMGPSEESLRKENILSVHLMFYLIMSGHIMLYFVPETDTSPPSAREASQPIAEMGLSETCHNVAWTNSSNRTLLASMNMKFIKIFDLRGSH